MTDPLDTTVLPDGEAEDYLRHFCQAVLDLLRQRPDQRPEFSRVWPGLARTLRGASREAVAHLRGEIRGWEAAAESLGRLSRSSYLQFGGEAAALLGKLEAARAQAESVVRALEGLPQGGDDRQSAGEADSDEPATASGVPATPSDLPDGSREITPPGEAALSDGERAAAIYREAEACRAGKDAAAAADLYTEALRLDPGLRPAYLRRGRILTFQGRTEQAVEDMCVALQLQSDDPTAYWWRGDAHALSGRHAAAVEDYTRALQLAPGLFLPRYNRAVSLRQGGDADGAMRELDELLRIKPAHGPLYLNRGLILLARGEPERALEDFRAALRYQPDSREAVQRLQETEALVLQQAAGRPAESSPAPIPVRASDEDEGEPEPPVERPPPPTAGRRERVDRLAYQCPGCGKAGAVRWDRLELGKVLACPHCKQRFISKVDGRLVRAVRDREGRWVDTEWMESQARNRRTRRRKVIGAALAAGVCVYTLSWTPALVGSLAPAAAQSELPSELQPRGELFTRAWLRGDLPLMRRLTDPVQDRMLFAWYKRNPPPAEAREAAGANFTVGVAPGQTSAATVRVRFDTIRAARGPGPLELQLAWVERGGNWIFQPVPDLKLPTGM
jgi:tetratricopeptide (TPR) repeat protein